MIKIEQPYTIYMDESRQGPMDNYTYSVTAYVADLIDGWHSRKNGSKYFILTIVCRIFNASDFWAGDDIYKKTLDWSDEKREKFLIRLATTAAGHTIIGIGLFRSRERV